MSPAVTCGRSALIIWSTGSPDGTMIQIALGGVSAFTSSGSENTAIAPLAATARAGSGLRLYATTRWPSLRSRSTILAPMRPSPMNPSSIPINSFRSSAAGRLYPTPDLRADKPQERVVILSSKDGRHAAVGSSRVPAARLDRRDCARISRVDVDPSRRQQRAGRVHSGAHQAQRAPGAARLACPPPQPFHPLHPSAAVNRGPGLGSGVRELAKLCYEVLACAGYLEESYVQGLPPRSRLKTVTNSEM